MAVDVAEWLRHCCGAYDFDIRGVFRRHGTTSWPLTVGSSRELEIALVEGGHILPLPKEPAALANVLEVSIVDFVLSKVEEQHGAEGRRGTERGYPDIELSGGLFGGGYHAVDVKVAKRAVNKRGVPTGSTQSRITLYTGNTYFRYPQLRWPGTFRSFNEYVTHLDILVIYTLVEESPWRVRDLELIVQQPWRIASRRRSSTTREYIGAVQNIEALRQGKGEFETPGEFYDYWRKYKFKIGDVVQKHLDKLLAAEGRRMTNAADEP
ncbi:MAG: type II restriction endonuclease [Pseudonocardiaceae bacterium]